jgi:hypothetical protein
MRARVEAPCSCHILSACWIWALGHRRAILVCASGDPRRTAATIATLRATDPDGASRLRQELTQLFQQYNVATDGITTVVGEYLDVQGRVA